VLRELPCYDRWTFLLTGSFSVAGPSARQQSLKRDRGSGRKRAKKRERERENKEGDTYTRAYTQESGVKYAGEARVFVGSSGRPIAFEF